MKMVLKIGLLFLMIIPCLTLAQGGKDYGQFAPADAWNEDSTLAYYGSENEWTRRMFMEARGHTQYKRRGQRQMLAIQEGHPPLAVKYCKKRLLKDPNDSETLYMLTVAWSQVGEIDSAISTMHKALDAGLPFERFLAGPRNLLEPLTQSEPFKVYMDKHSVQVVHGPMLGAVTDSSARFWLRTLSATQVAINVFKDSEGKLPIAYEMGETTSEQDYTTVIEVKDLEANTVYYYDVLFSCESFFEDTYPSFQTYSTIEKPTDFKIAFGGGAGFTPHHEYIWEKIAKQKLSAFLFLGDNVYIDVPQMPGPVHNYTYYRRQSQPEYRHLVQSTPVYAIWDDHDCAMDDVWMGPYKNKPDWKLPTLDLFKNNWNNPAYGTEEWPGCWFRFSIADVDFFMLDGRFYRTNPFADEKTMLGPVQKDWLLTELARSEATFKVIVSPVPWADGAKPGSIDTWAGYADEREEIFSLIEKKKIYGVFLLSADRHRSDAWKINRENGYDLYEFESSRLTNMHTHEVMPGALFGYNEKCSFGVLHFNTTREDPTVIYEIINIEGESIQSLEIKLSELTH
jgi:alkaline phosphatase D